MNSIGKKRFRVALDVDGTVTMQCDPANGLGAPVPFSLYWIEKWQEAGAEIYLWTMRGGGGTEGDTVTPAVNYLWDNGIKVDGVNRGEQPWTDSPKLYAQVYVDNAAAGAPLIYPANGLPPYLDWTIVGPLVYKMIREW
jgi:hypothetical protein